MHPPPHGKASGASARDEHAHARAAKDVSCPGCFCKNNKRIIINVSCPGGPQPCCPPAW
jgi:hypothetical protein